MVSDMATDINFYLDIDAAGKQILEEMAAEITDRSGQAIMQRASNMASKMSSTPPTFELKSAIGIIKVGRRAITTVTAVDDGTPHQQFIGHQALVKAKDAGRV